MDEKIIRIDDYSKFKEIHDSIVEIINNSKISGYIAIGILETIKQEIFLDMEQED